MAFTSPNWTAAQLAAANGLSPGLADYMLQHNTGADSNPANQQFYQAAGFMNPAGSQQMLNQAGRNWILANNQTYGNINADAGQSNGPRLQYGMTANGTPYSFSMHDLNNNPALAQWLRQARGGDPNLGAAPQGVTLYTQFQSGGQTPTMSTLNQGQSSPQSNAPTMPNLNGMYTGYGNTNISANTQSQTSQADANTIANIGNTASTNSPVSGTVQYQSGNGQGAVQQVGIPNGGFSPVTTPGVTPSNPTTPPAPTTTKPVNGGGSAGSVFMQNLNHVLN